MWNYRWFFEPGTPDGFNDGGIAEFKSTKYDGLAREIIQNSIDAKDELKIDNPVKVSFEKLILDIQDFPNLDDFLINVEKCIDFIRDDENNRSIKDLERIKTVLEKVNETGKFVVLKISDYNTTGLNGFKSKVKTPWANLVRISGNNSKRAGSGGSFGIGKYAPFVFSNIRALIYSTKTADSGEIAVQGKTILSGHESNGDYRTPNGYFGKKGVYMVEGTVHEDSDPFVDPNDIPEVFIRKEAGTSIYVLCASLPIEWVREVESSVINSFFYSIYNNMLEVEIKSDDEYIVINKDNIVNTTLDLLKLIQPRDLKLSNEYLKLLENIDDCVYNDTHIFDLPNGTKGMMKLYLFSNKEIEGKSIAHIRKTGMKIEEKSPRSLINYVGINITENDEMNRFLTECEAPKHDMWSSNNYGYEEHQDLAKKILNEMTQWERDAVRELVIPNANDHIDPLGMSEYLSSEIDGENDDNSTPSVVLNFKPIETEIKSRKDSNKTYTDIDIVDGIIESEDGDEEMETSLGNNTSSGGTGSGNGGSPINIQNGGGNRVPSKKIAIKYVKTPYINSGKYIVSFIPQENASNCFLKFRSAGDDVFENLKTTSIYLIKSGFKQLVDTFDIKNGEKIIFEVEFEKFDRGALEVSCYVKK